MVSFVEGRVEEGKDVRRGKMDEVENRSEGKDGERGRRGGNVRKERDRSRERGV